MLAGVRALQRGARTDRHWSLNDCHVLRECQGAPAERFDVSDSAGAAAVEDLPVNPPVVTLLRSGVVGDVLVLIRKKSRCRQASGDGDDAG